MLLTESCYAMGNAAYVKRAVQDIYESMPPNKETFPGREWVEYHADNTPLLQPVVMKYRILCVVYE